jgi:hypothetical protein
MDIAASVGNIHLVERDLPFLVKMQARGARMIRELRLGLKPDPTKRIVLCSHAELHTTGTYMLCVYIPIHRRQLLNDLNLLFLDTCTCRTAAADDVDSLLLDTWLRWVLGGNNDQILQY